MKRIVFLVLLVAVAAAGHWLIFTDGPEVDKSPPVHTEGDEVTAASAIRDPASDRPANRRESTRPTQAKPRPAKGPTPVEAPLPKVDRPTVTLEKGKDGIDLKGEILSPAGNPLPGAVAYLFRLASEGEIAAANRNLVREPVTSGPNGEIYFAALKGGSGYQLRVEHPAYANAETPLFDVAPSGLTQLPSITLESGSTLIGFITRGNAVPVSDAIVTIRDLRQPSKRDMEYATIAVLKSDKDGAFRIDNLARGSYDITASTPSLAIERSDAIHLGKNGIEERRITLTLSPGLTLLARAVDVANDGVEGVAVELRPTSGAGKIAYHATSGKAGQIRFDGLPEGEYQLTATCEGFREAQLRAVDAGDRNVVVRMIATAGVTGYVLAAADNAPLKNFGLQVWALGKNDLPNHQIGTLTAYSSEDGSFTIENLSSGRYKLKAFHNNYAATWSDPFDIRRVFVHGLAIHLSPGTLLSGTVVDSRGDPIPDAKVSLLSNNYQESAVASMIFGPESKLGSARSDSEGKFTFENLEAGVYQIRVTANGYASIAQRDLSVEGTSTDCGRVALSEGGHLTIGVFDDRGIPARGAKVTLFGETGDSTTKSVDADGEISFDNLIPGTYRLSVIGETKSDPSAFLAAAITSARDQRTIEVLEGRRQKELFTIR